MSHKIKLKINAHQELPDSIILTKIGVGQNVVQTGDHAVCHAGLLFKLFPSHVSQSSEWNMRCPYSNNCFSQRSLPYLIKISVYHLIANFHGFITKQILRKNHLFQTAMGPTFLCVCI